MRTLKNRKLSEHFWLYEVIEGTVMSAEGHRLNWEHIDELNIQKQINLAVKLEEVRRAINKGFRWRNGNKEIGLQITSGWRCRAWELMRGRSGDGRHPLDAWDVIPINVDKLLSDEIVRYMNSVYSPRIGGWKGGFAIKEPTATTTGFAHFDDRGVVARWSY